MCMCVYVCGCVCVCVCGCVCLWGRCLCVDAGVYGVWVCVGVVVVPKPSLCQRACEWDLVSVCAHHPCD